MRRKLIDLHLSAFVLATGTVKSAEAGTSYTKIGNDFDNLILQETRRRKQPLNVLSMIVTSVRVDLISRG